MLDSRTAALTRCVLSVSLAAFAAGCAYRTPPVDMPEPMPAIAPQKIEVLEVTVVDRTPGAESEVVDPEVVADVRREVTELLTNAAKARGAADRLGSASACAEDATGAPARVHVRVEILWSRDIYDSMRVDGMAVMGLFFAPLGLVMGREEVSLDLAVETGGRVFAGHGSGDRMGGLYASAQRRALAEALDHALADASQGAARAAD